MCIVVSDRDFLYSLFVSVVVMYNIPGNHFVVRMLGSHVQKVYQFVHSHPFKVW